MTRIHKHLLTVGLLAGMATAAFAQAPAPAASAARGEGQQFAHRHGPQDAARMQEHRAQMEKRMAERMEFFKFKLKVSPTQEGAWTTWTSAMKPAANRPQRPDRAELERLTTPERIDRMRALRTARQAENDRRMEATKTFYATLNADQKKTFDEASLKMLQHRGGGRGGHGDGERHHRG
jgi:protein CpxP